MCVDLCSVRLWPFGSCFAITSEVCFGGDGTWSRQAPTGVVARREPRWVLERTRSRLARPSRWQASALVLAAILPLFLDAGGTLMSNLVLAAAYVVMALGLNIIVGFAGLLDLGYVAFFAIGAYTAGYFALGLLGSRDRRRGSLPGRRLAGKPAGHPLQLPAHLRARGRCHGRRRRADRSADAAPSRRLHRRRHARLRRDHRPGSSIERRARSSCSAGRSPPARAALGRSTRSTAAPRAVRVAGPTPVVLVRPGARRSRVVREPTTARLAPRPGMDRAARRRVGRRERRRPARAHQAAGLRHRRGVRRPLRRVPGLLPGLVNAGQFEFSFSIFVFAMVVVGGLGSIWESCSEPSCCRRSTTICCPTSSTSPEPSRPRLRPGRVLSSASTVSCSSS